MELLSQCDFITHYIMHMNRFKVCNYLVIYIYIYIYNMNYKKKCEEKKDETRRDDNLIVFTENFLLV